MDKLSNCPICGKRPITIRWTMTSDYSTICDICGDVYTADFSTREEAEEEWNAMVKEMNKSEEA